MLSIRHKIWLFYRIVETGVTVMCGCTSALVTFWKSHIATHVAPLYSRLCFRSRTLATRFKVVSKTSSSNQIYPPEPVQSKQYSTLYNLNYVELDEHYQESAVLPGSIVRTTVGSGSPRSDVETGVIRKFTTVEQSFNWGISCLLHGLVSFLTITDLTLYVSHTLSNLFEPFTC